MIIDAHQHFWTLSRGDYPWPNDTVAPIFRDFTPDDLRPHLKDAGVDQTILIQATDTVAETEFLLQIAETTDFVAGVVGWVDLTAPDAIATIDLLRRNKWLKGLRPMLQNIADTDWILQKAATPALAHMAKCDLVFDALIQPRHLPTIATLAQRHPTLRIVVDHIAKPQMGERRMPSPTYLTQMLALARHPNIFCKLSGMVTEAGDNWSDDDLLPFAKSILTTFGPDRILFGSDWPVVNLASDYSTWIAFVRAFIAPLPIPVQERILGGTARCIYRI